MHLLFYRIETSFLYDKNAPRGSHCGGMVECRLRDPPQAENPVEQDSFSSLSLSGTDFAFIDFSCNFFQFIL